MGLSSVRLPGLGLFSCADKRASLLWEGLSLMNGKVTYRQQFTRCGKQRCKKCREGAGHGPYWYAYWSENGRTVSKYVGLHPPAGIEVTHNEAGLQQMFSLEGKVDE